MNIKYIRAYRKLLPLKRPYTIARSTISDSEIVFFEVELANGIKGIGAANTEFAVVGETAAMTMEHLESDKVAALAGKDIRQFLSLIRYYRELYAGFPGTQAAIDIALHDAFGKWLGIPVLDFYGRAHSKMLTSVTIGIKDVPETLEEAQEYFESGFRVLKVKTGLDAETDAERIIKLRERYGSHFTLRVDANTGYNPDQLKIFLKRTENENLELIEQPFLPGMENDLLDLPRETRSRLAADESLKDARSALTLSHQLPFGIFNIKLMKCGGITGAFEIATIARQADISLFWGCNDESRVSITAALHAAFACPHTRYIDLDGSFDLAEDVVTGGFTLENGLLIPNGEPGLGVSFI